ncbi:MAG: hypothetical protein R3E89_01760 [Thiolinea sp.]
MMTAGYREAVVNNYQPIEENIMSNQDSCCTLVPYFKVHDGQLEAFKALGEQFVAKTATEEKCVHYAFSFSGDIAHCREGYADAAGMLAHLENVDDVCSRP